MHEAASRLQVYICCCWSFHCKLDGSTNLMIFWVYFTISLGQLGNLEPKSDRPLFFFAPIAGFAKSLFEVGMACALGLHIQIQNL